MQRIIVVHNPRSSKHKLVEDKVLAGLRGVPGVAMGRFEVKQEDVNKNAERLAMILRDKDLVVSAGGDGTAAVAINACMMCEKDVSFAAMPYGNFNDTAQICRIKDIGEMVDSGKMQRRGKAVEVWPLEIIIDGKHWRWALGYVTMGLFAESTAIFDKDSMRSLMQNGKKGKVFAWKSLAKWYFKNHKGTFLPNFVINDEKMPEGTTDYIAMNTVRMGGVMKGREWFLQKKEFVSGAIDLKRVSSLAWFMIRSIIHKVPLWPTRGDEIRFAEKAKIMIQAEGEYAEIEAQKIKIRKAAKSLKIVRN